MFRVRMLGPFLPLGVKAGGRNGPNNLTTPHIPGPPQATQVPGGSFFKDSSFGPWVLGPREI